MPRRTLLFFICLAAAFPLLGITQENAPDFFSWLDNRGNPHFTDDLKKVPIHYRDQAQAHTWTEQASKVERKMTLSDPIAKPVLRVAAAELEEVVVVGTKCDGYATVTQAWNTVDGITRMYYTLRNRCGEIIAITPYTPAPIYHEP